MHFVELFDINLTIRKETHTLLPMTALLAALRAVGMSDKAAKVYLSAAELGEATVLSLAARSGVKRTSIYYVIDELLAWGALTISIRGKKKYYEAARPDALLRRARERISDFEDAVPELTDRFHSAFPRPRIYFLYGVPGFKQVWEKIFQSPSKEYCITTDGSSFLDFVKEKYIVRDIIRRKNQLNIKSRQLIVSSSYARSIIAKDTLENRTSKLLPPQYQIPFTQIICANLVAYISQRYENTLIVIESDSFSKTQSMIFNLLWNLLPPHKK